MSAGSHYDQRHDDDHRGQNGHEEKVTGGARIDRAQTWSFVARARVDMGCQEQAPRSALYRPNSRLWDLAGRQ